MAGPKSIEFLWIVFLASTLSAGRGGEAATLPDLAGPYRIVEEESFIEDCFVCAAPPQVLPIHGSFRLRPGTTSSGCARFVVLDMSFTSNDSPPSFIGKGRGVYRLIEASAGQEGFLLQQMKLDLLLNGIPVRLDSGFVPLRAPLPWIEIDAMQTLAPDAGLAFPSYRLRIVAVPWPRLLFSTRVPFTPSGGRARASDGDLLSTEGEVVLTNQEITKNLGIMPVAPDVGLDAVLVRTSATPVQVVVPDVLFSSAESFASETLGAIGDGDVLSMAGAVVRKNADLIGAFSPMPPVVDFGLDALAYAPDGKLLFSIDKGFFSESLGTLISSGDILKEDGTIFMSEAQLLSSFGLVPGEEGPGLDAVSIWPHGEIWFSTERRFTDEGRYGAISEGDLLSSVGRVVARNLELLDAFAPTEATRDFGLDGLHWDSREAFDECGTLIEGVECILFRSDAGGLYVIFNRGNFVPGDRVRVTGILAICDTTCQQGQGCILGNTIEACDFDGCGQLVAGPESCVLFETDGGARYLLDNLGDFQVGDRVHVTGAVQQGCNSVCVVPCAAIVQNTIGLCGFEDCGRLVEIAGCIFFEAANGDRYLVENLGLFAAGDTVFVEGVLGGNCRQDCPGVEYKGCIGDNEIDAAGPVGEVGFFRRADCNADGSEDVADAVYGLLYLFSSGETPACMESCNSNGDAEVDITDPIHTLRHLFLGGSAPPFPFPECGEVRLQIFCGGNPCPCIYPEQSCED